MSEPPALSKDDAEVAGRRRPVIGWTYVGGPRMPVTNPTPPDPKRLCSCKRKAPCAAPEARVAGMTYGADRPLAELDTGTDDPDFVRQSSAPAPAPKATRRAVTITRVR